MEDQETYIAKVTTKGQVTLPREVREVLGTEEGDYVLFARRGRSFEIQRVVLSPKEEFEAFARPIRERFEKEGITPEDVEEAIQWARAQKRKT